MQMVLSASAGGKALNIQELRIAISAGSWSSAAEPRVRRRRKVLIRKSMDRSMNTKSVKTWKARPAIMMLSPVSVDSPVWKAEEARPPPAAWRIRETMSQGMNYKLRLVDFEFIQVYPFFLFLGGK